MLSKLCSWWDDTCLPLNVIKSRSSPHTIYRFHSIKVPVVCAWFQCLQNNSQCQYCIFAVLHPCLSSWTHSPRDGVLNQVFLNSHTVWEHCQENPSPHCHSWQALIIPLWESRRGRKKNLWSIVTMTGKGEKNTWIFCCCCCCRSWGISSILTLEALLWKYTQWQVACIFQDGAFPLLQSVFRPYLLAWFRIWGLHSVYGLIGDFWRFFVIYLLIFSNAETMNSWLRWLLSIYHGSYSSLLDYS